MYIMVRIKNIAKHIRLNKKENVTPLGNTFVLAPFPNSFVIVRIC